MKFSTTQINAPDTIAQRITKAAQQIPDEELKGHGRATGKPHITVLWGLTEDEPDEKLQAIVSRHFPFYIKLGKTTTFPASESSDWAAPLIVEVHSPLLKKLHEEIKAALPNEPSEHKYHAHMTVAYLDPKFASKYEGHSMLDGVEFIADGLTFSNRKAEQTLVKPK